MCKCILSKEAESESGKKHTDVTAYSAYMVGRSVGQTKLRKSRRKKKKGKKAVSEGGVFTSVSQNKLKATAVYNTPKLRPTRLAGRSVGRSVGQERGRGADDEGMKYERGERKNKTRKEKKSFVTARASYIRMCYVREN